MEMSMIARACAFAEERHRGQTRKDRARTPYLAHPEEVARLVAGFGGGEAAVAAAWLHDTVEDCPPTSLDEIGAVFGPVVARIVAEVTDDKALAKAERKRLQVVRAPSKSAEAALVKLCDKISNVRSLGASPPVAWPLARRRACLDWAEAVVAGLGHLPAEARAAFAATLREARGALDRR